MYHFRQVCVLGVNLTLFLCVLAFSLHVAVGLVRTMELVCQSTRRTAVYAFVRRNSQGNFAKQVRNFSLLLHQSTKNNTKVTPQLQIIFVSFLCNIIA